MAQEIAPCEDERAGLPDRRGPGSPRSATSWPQAEAAGDFEAAPRLHQQLDGLDGYDIERRAERMLEGLGFAPGDGAREVNSFSGGWRIRLNLGRALMAPSDLLLLDEPTNHLDLDATLWLEQWLAAYPGHPDPDLPRPRVYRRHLRPGAACGAPAYQRLQGQLLLFRETAGRAPGQSAGQLREAAAPVAEIDAFVGASATRPPRQSRPRAASRSWSACRTIAPAHVDSPFSFFLPGTRARQRPDPRT